MTIDAVDQPIADVVLPKRADKFKWGEIPLHIVLIAIGLIVSTPIFIAFFMSFTPLKEIVTRATPEWIPDTWVFDNYRTAWNATPFGRYMVNSFVQTGLITWSPGDFFSILAGIRVRHVRVPVGRTHSFVFRDRQPDRALRTDRSSRTSSSFQRPRLGQHVRRPGRAVPGQRLRRLHAAPVLHVARPAISTMPPRSMAPAIGSTCGR